MGKEAIKIIKSELIKLTVNKAKEFLSINTYSAQKALRPSWIKELTSRINSGIVINFEIGIAVNHSTSEKILMNGQHSCSAVVLSGKEVNATITYYEITTSNDLAFLYSQFDTHPTRSIADIVKCKVNALTLDWALRNASLVSGAAKFIENKSTTGGKWGQANLIEKWTKEGKFFDQLVSNNKDHRHIKRVAVVAAILQTFKKYPEIAEKFWTNVRDGEYLRSKDPAFKLREYLLKTTTYRHATRASRKEIYSKCIIAFNAAKQGRTTDLKYYSNGGNLPKIV